MQGLAQAVFRVEVVTRELLRPVDERDLLGPPHSGEGAQAAQFLLEAVLSPDAAEEDAVGAVLEVPFGHVRVPSADGLPESIAQGAGPEQDLPASH